MQMTGEPGKEKQSQNNRKKQVYYVYLLRCVDNSLYAGITTDVERRLSEHLTGGKKGAKYTKTHTPKEMAAVWRVENRSAASKLEWRLKHLTKAQKEMLCKEPGRIAEFVTAEEAGYAPITQPHLPSETFVS
ncbi:MAG: GIY-YIG nuclease family protein [Lachnospiraceae bacterium]|nr:GIY-YIG nuclease family protein [Lachnospiraceae bacterium]